MKKTALVLLFIVLTTVQLYSQSTNCTTATNLSLSGGSACVNGTSAGAISDNILYGSCNAAPVNMVWYTYVTNGSNNNFTITPGTLTNAEIVIYQGGCPNTGTLQNCVTATGSTPLVTTWGMTAGVQVWIGIASNGGVSGSFQFCVNSQPPAPGPGNTCAQAKLVCTSPFSQATIPSNSSGQKPACFGSAPQQDIWIKFTITQAGLLAWTATGNNTTTEFDWALWDITNGCPGTLACCNYNYAAGSGQGFGMQTQAGNVACGFSGASGDPAEFCAPINVTCGKTYAIQISNFSNNNVGFSLSFINSTAMINSNAAFSVNAPTLVCGPSLNAVINNASTGACAEVWNYGDGSPSYTGTAPPAHNYTTPGTYAITANIGGACPSSATQFVQLLAPLAATATPSPVSCPGQCNGSATVSPVTGGDGIYTYLWNTGSTNTSINGLCAGIYSITVSNAKCSSSVTQTVNIISPPTLVLTPTSVQPSCGNSNGSISLSASGGTAPYTYALNAGVFGAGNNFTGLSAGTHTVTVKDSKNCTMFTTVTLSTTPNPIVTVPSVSTCAGVSVGLAASGANTYAWSPATGLSSTSGANVNATLNSTTTYTIIGTAVGGCTASTTAMVTVNTLPAPLASNTGPYCPGSTIQLNVGAFATYTWSGPSSFSSNSQNPTILSSTASNGGVYTVTVTNANGCINSSSTTVVMNTVPNPIIGSNSPVCLGGSINLTSNGGTSYSWSGPPAFSSTLQNPTIAGATLSNSGLYTVTVTASGCSSTATVNVIVTTPTTSASNTGPYCAGTAIQLNNPGASTYTWSGPAGFNSNAQNPTLPSATPAMSGNYTVLVSIGTCTASATTSVTVNALPAPIATNTGPYCPGNTISLSGSAASSFTWSGPASFNANSQNATVASATPSNSGVYTYSVTDANGCVGGTSTGVTVNPTPSITIGSNNPVCLNNTINLSATGGTSYSWSGPAAFTSIAQNPTVSGATSANDGVYTVTVTALSCTNTASVNVSVLTPTTTASNNGPYCAGSTIQLNTPGATSYTWSGPAAFASNAQNPTRPGSTTPMSGNYTVLVNIGTCTAIATTSVTVNALPVPTASNTGPYCPGNTISLNGSAANTFTWSGPGAFSSNIQNPNIASATPSNSGVYSYSVTDANGCIGGTSTSVTVNPTPMVSATGATVCENTSAQLNASGGVSYSWNGPGFTSLLQNPVILNATSANAGQYSVLITDANTCTNIAVTSIAVNPSAVPVISSNGPICAKAVLMLSASGGNQYNWTGPNGFVSTVQNPTIATTSSVSSGVYFVNVSVNGGCGGTSSVNVVVNPLPIPVIFSGLNKGCAPLCVTYSVQSSPAASSTSWNFGNGLTATNGSVSASCYNTPGSYEISALVTDVNGCTATATYPAEVYPKPVADFVFDPIKPLENADDVHFTDISYGAPIVSWNWYLLAGKQYTFNVQNPVYIYQDAGIYPVVLIVKSDKGCIDTVLKTITVSEDFGIYVPNAFTPNGDGVNDVFTAKGFGIVKFQMQIFDRWGESIFVTDNIQSPWLGNYQGRGDKICQDDVYVWRIRVTTINGKAKEMTGHVTLYK